LALFSRAREVDRLTAPSFDLDACRDQGTVLAGDFGGE